MVKILLIYLSSDYFSLCPFHATSPHFSEPGDRNKVSCWLVVAEFIKTVDAYNMMIKIVRLITLRQYRYSFNFGVVGN